MKIYFTGVVMVALLARCWGSYELEGPKTGAANDELSEIKCRGADRMTDCSCKDPNTCDGAAVTKIKNGKAICTAVNRDGKSGTQAKIKCNKVKVFRGPATENFAINPSVTCPKGYRLWLCDVINPWSHESPVPEAVTDVSTGTCSAKCTKKTCYVYSVCAELK